MNASDLMSAPVLTVAPDTSVHAIVERLLSTGISGMPVVDASGAVIGLVGEGELIHRHENGTDQDTARRAWWKRLFEVDPPTVAYARSHAREARDIMNTEVHAVDEATPVAAIATLFESRSIRRVPVLRNGSLVGIVTRRDLIRLLRDAAPPVAVGDRSDDAIAAELRAELERQPWWHDAGASIRVTGGVVYLRGLVGRECDKPAARIAAENVPGVRGVVDQRFRITDYPVLM